jgi:anti-sigma B factor antagonist
MELSMSDAGGATVVRVDDTRIDAAVAIQFKDAMRELTGSAQGRVVLDLGAVSFIDSSGLGAIVAVMKFLGPGRRLELAALTPNVERVFRLTRMNEVFRILPSSPGADAAHAS